MFKLHETILALEDCNLQAIKDKSDFKMIKHREILQV